MKPAVINWQAFNNEDWAGAIGVVFSDQSPFDWSQYSAIAMQIKADQFAPEAELTLALGSGLTVRAGDASTLDFAAALDDVKDLLGSYVYDIIGTNAGDMTMVVRGSIIVSQGITR